MLDSKKRGLIVMTALMLGGCASTKNNKFGGTAESRTIAVVGDRPMPATVGEPGGQVSAGDVEPEPRRSTVARISGRVLDEQGRPVPDATVRLADGGAKGGRDIQVTTDASGAFTLGGLRSASSYTLVAEVGEGRDLRIGRTRAKTSETGVEINLMAKDDGSTATHLPSSSSNSARVKPISNRDVDEEPEADRPRINLEDTSMPGEDAGPGDARRARLTAPEPGVGWRSPGSSGGGPTRAARNPDESVDSVATSGSPSRSRRAKAPSQPVESGDDGDDPLPAAKEFPDDSVKPRSSTTRRKPAPRPETDDDAETAPVPRNRQVDDRRGSTSPAPMPSFEDVAVAGTATSPQSPSIDPRLALLAGPPSSHLMQVVGGSPPPSPDPTTNPMTPTTPAPQPVLALTEPAKNSEPEGSYNPFALVAANEPVDPPAAVTNPQSAQPESIPAPEAPAAPAATASPLPKKTWGELSVRQAKAPEAKPTKATAFLARFKQPGLAEVKRDVAVASVDFDPKARKLTDFTLPDLQGNPVRFQDFEADYILLDFWGTQYKQCLDSIPHLVELQKKYGPTRLKVVGIACEKGTSKARKVQVDDFTRRLAINYAILLSDMTTPCPVQKALGVRYYPTMFLLDRQGQVVWEAAGATPSNLYRLDSLLAKNLKPATAQR